MGPVAPRSPPAPAGGPLQPIFGLRGPPLPAGATRALADAGFTPAGPGAVGPGASPALIGGTGWDEALDQAAALPAAQRAAALLWADAPPSPGLGRRCRALGLLGWWAPPFDPWPLEAARWAVGRGPSPWSPPLSGSLPLGLDGAAAALGRRLGGEGVGVVQGSTGWEYLDAGRSGAALPDGWLRAAASRGGDLELPWAPAAGLGPDPGGAVAGLVLQVPGGARPAALLLRFGAPFFPTPAERELAEAVRAAAGAAWARAAELERQTQAHEAAVKALVELPWAPAAVGPDEPTELDPRERFLRETVRARSFGSELLGLWVRPSPARRLPALWTALGPAPGPPRRAEVGDGVEALAGGGWTAGARHPVDEPLHQVRVVAEFRSAEAAAAGRLALRRLAADVDLGLGLLRRASDTAALSQLARLAASERPAADIAVEVLQLCASQLGADGAKVFVLAEDGERRYLEPLLHSGQPGAPGRRAEVEAERGLADWVISYGFPLSVEHPADGGPARCVSPGRPPFTRAPRREQEFFTEAAGDPEKHQLLVPLRRGDQLLGVLSVWRATPHPFDPRADLASLEGLAPHVTAVCARLRGRARAERERRAIHALAAELVPALRPREADARAAALALELSDAPLCLLLRHDLDEPGALAVTAAAGEGAEGHPGQVVEWPADPAGWEAAAGAWLDHQGLLLDQLVILPGAAGASAFGALLLARRAGAPAPVLLLGADRARGAVATFGAYAAGPLRAHPGYHAGHLIDALAQGQGGPAADDPLRAVAAALVELVPGAVSWWAPVGGLSPQVLGCLPASAGLQGAVVSAAGLGPRLVRVLDLSSGRSKTSSGLDVPLLRRVASAMGWKEARSWMALPVAQPGGPTYALCVLTRAGAEALNPGHAEVAGRLAAWAAAELARTAARRRLDALHELLARFVGATPRVLADQLPAAIADWSKAHLRGGCGVHIGAWGPPGPLLRAHTEGLRPADADWLEAESQVRAGQPWGWARSRGKDGPELLKRHTGVSAPLRLVSAPGLRGHLTLLHHAPFGAEEAAAVDQAARELSVLLHSELVRQEWKLQAGLFRHALLGPAQGLQSAADLVLELAADPDRPAELFARARRQVAAEAEQLRLWRDTQKVYAALQEGLPPEVVPVRQPVVPVVRACVDRWYETFQKRGVELRADLPAGGVEFHFDKQAVDLILSNLLDNASKYSFYNRPVTVSLSTDRERVRVAVEDIGHPIPDGLHEQIYDAGVRAEGRDPIRAIPGEGIGLYLARALARAHGGDLTHTCELDGAARFERTPYRVRFTLSLPHGWPRTPHAPRGAGRLHAPPALDR
jgi:signal transduction histidine kinase/GAF domain-containing protein